MTLLLDSATILALGDIHLGTSCSGVPDEIGSGLDLSDLTPAAAFTQAVDFAIAQKVDAVLFAGDIVESTNARFEAFLPLEKGVRRLVDARIQVLAVAGNHDVEALPRLARLIDGFVLLGAGGKWEARTITKNGSPVAEIIGWSFGERIVRQSPVAQLLAEPLERLAPSTPRIGLLHADLDAAGGRYAPISQFELDRTGYDAWLLGHIHKPSYESLRGSDSARPCGYLGSLVGLDPTETGPHGPWLLKVSDDRSVQLEQVPLAPLRWENVTIPVSNLEHVEDVPDRLLAEAEQCVRRLQEGGATPLALGLRAKLTGTSPLYDQIRQRIARGEWKTLNRMVDGTVAFFNKITDAMAMALDLEDIAAGDDPAALMAGRLLLLQANDERSLALLESARAKLATVALNEFWSPVAEHRSAADPLSDDALRETLIRAGTASLHAMLSSRRQSEAP